MKEEEYTEWLRSQTCIQILIPPLNGRVTLDKALHLSEPLVPHLHVEMVKRRARIQLCHAQRLTQCLLHSRWPVVVAVYLLGKAFPDHSPEVLPPHHQCISTICS